MSAVANVTITTDVVITDFVTYCPEPTSLVVNNKTITVVEPTTITILGPCTIPTTIVGPSEEPSKTKAEESKTPAPEVTEIENGANKAVAGAFAGVAAVAAALL
ncbi:predicted GPI-anchored protein 26 [Diutina catenulata]